MKSAINKKYQATNTAIIKSNAPAVSKKGITLQLNYHEVKCTTKLTTTQW